MLPTGSVRVSMLHEASIVRSGDHLAAAITELDPSEQEILLDKVAQLNFQKGLHKLAEKYRGRLARQGQLSEPLEQIWLKLHHLREQIAQHDYSA